MLPQTTCAGNLARVLTATTPSPYDFCVVPTDYTNCAECGGDGTCKTCKGDYYRNDVGMCEPMITYGVCEGTTRAANSDGQTSNCYSGACHQGTGNCCTVSTSTWCMHTRTYACAPATHPHPHPHPHPHACASATLLHPLPYHTHIPRQHRHVLTHGAHTCEATSGIPHGLFSSRARLLSQ